MPHFTIRYRSIVYVYADHLVEADTPRDAAVKGRAYVDGGNVGALDWVDEDGDEIGGLVEDDEIALTVYDEDDKTHLGDEDFLLASG